MMAYKNRSAIASRIMDVRYAVKSGACVVAGNFLREIAAHAPGLKPSTFSALVRQVNRCKTAPRFRKRRSRR
jgi:hypothetical protein